MLYQLLEIVYTTGRITAYIKQHTQCSSCLNAFLTTSEIHADTISFSCDHLPEGLSRFARINKDFIHPNVKLYKAISDPEISTANESLIIETENSKSPFLVNQKLLLNPIIA